MLVLWSGMVAAGVFLPAFIVGMRISDAPRAGAFLQGLVFDVGGSLYVYVSLLGLVMLAVLAYVALLWPFCRWAPIAMVRVAAVLGAAVVPLVDVLPGRGYFTDYPVASAAAALLYGLTVAAGIPDGPERVEAAVRKLVHVPPKRRTGSDTDVSP